DRTKNFHPNACHESCELTTSSHTIMASRPTTANPQRRIVQPKITSGISLTVPCSSDAGFAASFRAAFDARCGSGTLKLCRGRACWDIWRVGYQNVVTGRLKRLDGRKVSRIRPASFRWYCFGKSSEPPEPV